MPLILASGSPTRLRLLRNAGVPVTAEAPRLDEDAIRAALAAEGASPRDMADTLAEMKAQKVAARHPQAVVLGADQVLDLDGEAFGKPAGRDELRAQLHRLRGRRHQLHSAVVLFADGAPQWRLVGEARLTMRALTDEWIEAYLNRNPGLLGTVGGYLLEGEGLRLFSAVEGDYFTILGLPLLPLLLYLDERGLLP
jgi:septum formation protein